MAATSSGTPVFPELQLCVFLRYLCGGSYLDISFGYEIEEKSVCGIVWRVLNAIDRRVHNIEFKLDDNEQMLRQARDFQILADGHIEGCVAAGDGLLVEVRLPAAKDVPGGNNVVYISRKGWPAIAVQAFADAQKRFLYIDASRPGSTHDITSYQSCPLSWAIEDGKLDTRFHMALDEAYVCTSQEVTPWPERQLPPEKDSFNYWHARQRQVIECCFGILIMRWGLFWRALRMNIRHWGKLITVAAKLHNICRNRQLMSEQMHHLEVPDTVECLLEDRIPFYHRAVNGEVETGLDLHPTNNVHGRERRDLSFTRVREGGEMHLVASFRRVRDPVFEYIHQSDRADSQLRVPASWLSSTVNGIGESDADAAGTTRRRDLECSDIRAKLTQRLQANNILRPGVNTRGVVAL